MLALLIDGLNLVRRIHAGVPVETDPAAHADGVLIAFERSLARALAEHEPTHAALVFDGAGPSWRTRLHPPYKADRPPMPEDLRALFPRIEAVLRERKVASIAVAGYEADDVIATMAMQVANRGGAVLVLSTDRGFAQLARPGIRIRDHFAGVEMDEAMTLARYGVSPSRLTSVLALVGKPSDGIPGVPGVGPKTASAWVSEFGALESMLEDIARLPERPAKILGAHREPALLSLRLVTLDTAVQVGVNLKELRWRPAER